MLIHLQKLEVRSTAFKSISQNEQFMNLIRKVKEAYGIDGPDVDEEYMHIQKSIMKAHTDGFNLGLMHGKFLQGQIERSLLINEGQLNGVKHGWLEGFEAGQIQGVK